MLNFNCLKRVGEVQEGQSLDFVPARAQRGWISTEGKWRKMGSKRGFHYFSSCIWRVTQINFIPEVAQLQAAFLGGMKLLSLPQNTHGWHSFGARHKTNTGKNCGMFSCWNGMNWTALSCSERWSKHCGNWIRKNMWGDHLELIFCPEKMWMSPFLEVLKARLDGALRNLG